MFVIQGVQPMYVYRQHESFAQPSHQSREPHGLLRTRPQHLTRTQESPAQQGSGATSAGSLVSLAFPFSRARCRDPYLFPQSLLPLPFLLLASQIACNELYSPVPGFSVLPPILLRTALILHCSITACNLYMENKKLYCL